MQAAVLAEVLSGTERSYDRGIWYNSAKFVDLEYHTYGKVSPGLGPPFHDEEQSLYWSHPSGRHSLRIAHVDGRVVGFNALGWRLRHRVCEGWIAAAAGVDEVLDNLGRAGFDPELGPHHEATVVGVLREQLP
jgi:hypothetical protein